MAGINKNELINKNSIENAFNYFDANKSGFIEVEDLEETLLKMGKECTDQGGIKSIIQHTLFLLKNKAESDDLNSDFNFSDDENINNKISKEDFFNIFEISLE